MLADRAYEQLEELVLSSLGLWTDRLVLIEYVGYVEEKRMKQRQGDLTLVTVAFLPHFLPEERVGTPVSGRLRPDSGAGTDRP